MPHSAPETVCCFQAPFTQDATRRTKRLCALVEAGKPLPFDVKNQVIYYAGPCPAKPGDPIGSCGPTTSYRMDAYASTLCDLGLIGMIGKGSAAPK